MYRRLLSSWRRDAGIIITVFLTSMVISGCDLIPVIGDLGIDPQPTTATTQRPPSPPAASTPRPTATVVPTSTPKPAPAPTPSVTPLEAEAVVRAWFDALAAEDYVGVERLTADNATLHTRALTDTLQHEASSQNVDIDIVSRRVDAKPGLRPERGEAVDTDFQIDINALVGPFSFTARQLLGTATFIVDSVDGEIMIVDIRDVTGLPEAES